MASRRLGSEHLLEYARERLKVAVAARQRYGLVPYEGRWVTHAELRSELAAKARGRKVTIIELTLAYFGLTLIALAFVGLTILIAY